MLQVNFSPKQFNPTSALLSWEVLNTNFGDRFIKGFNILFSESPNAEFSIVNETLIDALEFKHVNFNYTKGKNFYYKIQAVLSDDSVEESSILKIFPDQFLSMKTIMQVHMFQTMSGVSQIKNTPVIFYQKRTSGVECPRCGINKKIGNVSSKCIVCYGTGYDGGYYPPVLAWIDYKQSFGLSLEKSALMKTHTSSQIITTSAYFLVPRPEDYFRELFVPNRLFSVVEIMQRSEDGNRPMSITFSAKEENSQHPLYLKDVPYIEFPDRVYYNKVFEVYDEFNNRIKEITK